MIKELLETGYTFEDKFKKTTTIDLDSFFEDEILSEYRSDFFKWLSKVGTVIEGNYKEQYPQFTKYIISLIRHQVNEKYDYNNVIKHLEKILEDEKKLDF